MRRAAGTRFHPPFAPGVVEGPSRRRLRLVAPVLAVVGAVLALLVAGACMVSLGYVFWRVLA
jgi:hypothetical protein